MRSWGFGLVYLIPISAVAGILMGAWLSFLSVVVVFGFIPALDLLIGRDPWNPHAEDEADLVADPVFKFWTWIAALLLVALVGWGAWIVTGGGLSPLEIAGTTVSVGLCSGGVGIVVAHELVHRRQPADRGLGITLLMLTCYTHWAVEHVSGHHRHVSTPRDPASARFGESLYAFLPRTILGGFVSAWGIERERLARKETGDWTPRNRVLRNLILNVVLVLAAGVAFGPLAVPYFLVQAFVGVLLLEVINYIEHYGLSRRQLEDGSYERVAPHHSWNASERLTNFLLFNLQRHSDHHAAAGRRYPVLRHMDEAPQLPTGYSGMVLLALVPPLWRAVVDPRVPGRS